MTVRRALLAMVVAVGVGCGPAARPQPLPPLPAGAYATYLRGQAALYEGDPAAALAAFDEAAALAPDQAGIAIARAQAIYQLDRRLDAAAAISLASKRWPRSPEVWLAAGRISRGAGELRRAIAAYDRAIALDRTMADAYLGLAAAHQQARDPARALATLRRLVRAVPDDAQGHARLATALLAQDDDAGAEPHLRRVLVLAPDRVDARLELAAIAYRAGRLTEAIELAAQATARSGDHLDAARELIGYLLEAGDRAGAIARLAGYDDSVPVEQQLDAAWLLLRLGELDRARTAAVAAGERGAASVVLRARIELGAGDLPRARALVDAVAVDDPAWPAGQVVAIEALWAEDDLIAAAARADAGLARAPDDTGLLAARAETSRRAGDPAAGRALLARAAHQRADDRGLALARASYEARAGDPTRALALAEPLLTDDPDDADALHLVGATLVAAGADLPRARRLLTRARALAPGDAGVLDSWGWMLRAAGDRDGAARAVARALVIAPLDAQVLIHAATIAVEQGRTADATRMLDRLPATAGPELRRAATGLRTRLGLPATSAGPPRRSSVRVTLGAV